MTHLLDTNICIAYLNGTDDSVRERLLDLSPRDVAICSVVKAELIFGARKSERVQSNLARLETFFAPLRSLPFDDAAAQWYGSIRNQLENAGSPIGANDLLIASIGRAHDAIVVTRNEGEFRRVPGLRVETW